MGKKIEQAEVVESKEVSPVIATVEKEIKPLANDLILFRSEVEAFAIESDDDYSKASDMLKTVNTKKKSIEETREFFVKPLNTQVKSINGIFKPQTEHADETIKILKNKMSEFFDKKERARIAEENRLQAIRDKANEKRAEQGKEEIAEPVKEVAEVAKTVSAGFSSTTVRKVWTHEIISMKEMPPEIKEAIMGEAFKKGIVTTVVQKFVDAGMHEISGVKVFQKNVVSVR